MAEGFVASAPNRPRSQQEERWPVARYSAPVPVNELSSDMPDGGRRQLTEDGNVEISGRDLR